MCGVQDKCYFFVLKVDNGYELNRKKVFID